MIYCIILIFVIFIVIINCQWDLVRLWKGIDQKELELELELIKKELELEFGIRHKIRRIMKR